jgi:hypothetical protein
MKPSQPKNIEENSASESGCCLVKQRRSETNILEILTSL